jgi:hypothetical protein
VEWDMSKEEKVAIKGLVNWLQVRDILYLIYLKEVKI